MHSSVFEVSRAPVSIANWARAGNLPDWFYEQVCDYAENPGPAQREAAIKQFSCRLGNLCTADQGQFILSPQTKERHFRKSYHYFRAAARALAQTDYKTFAESSTESAFHLALDGLNDSYEDRKGIYIYATESGELTPLDRWLRTADLSVPFYIGGAINYYCQN